MSSALLKIDVSNAVEETEFLGEYKQSCVSKSSGLLLSSNKDSSLLFCEPVIASSRLL